MEIRVYLHRTKKKQFEVADCFSVFVDLDKLPEDKNGNDTIKFSNKEMLFVKKRKPRAKKEEATNEKE